MHIKRVDCLYNSINRQSSFSHASLAPTMQEATLISNSMRTTHPPKAPRWLGRVLADETIKLKSGSKDIFAYFAMLTLFGF